MHAPLIIRAPGFPHATKVDRPVEFLDIYPTLVDLARLDAPDHLEGESLLPLLRDPQSSETRGLAFSQYPRGEKDNPMMGYTVRRGNWRYTEWLRTDTGEVAFRELYDLAKGPNVTRNLVGEQDYQGTVAELSASLEKAGNRVKEIRSLVK